MVMMATVQGQGEGLAREVPLGTEPGGQVRGQDAGFRGLSPTSGRLGNLGFQGFEGRRGSCTPLGLPPTFSSPVESLSVPLTP